MADPIHPAATLPMEERVDYLTVVAALVAADDKVDDREVARLLKLVEALEVSTVLVGEVLESAEEPKTERVRSALTRLAGSELRFTLMAELVFMAHADDELDDSEERELLSVAEAVGISEYQYDVIAQYVESVRKAQAFLAGTANFWKQKGRKMASKLADADVPTGALSVSSMLFAVGGEGPSPGLSSYKVGFGSVSGDVEGALCGLAGAGGFRWLSREVVEA